MAEQVTTGRIAATFEPPFERTWVDDSAETVKFLCSYPPIQSAIKQGRDGVRLQLEIPLSEVRKAKPAFDWFDEVLEVTIKVYQGVTYGGAETAQRSSRSPLDMVGG